MLGAMSLWTVLLYVVSDSNEKYLSYDGIGNALLVRDAANPKCLSAPPEAAYPT